MCEEVGLLNVSGKEKNSVCIPHCKKEEDLDWWSKSGFTNLCCRRTDAVMLLKHFLFTKFIF